MKCLKISRFLFGGKELDDRIYFALANQFLNLRGSFRSVVVVCIFRIYLFFARENKHYDCVIVVKNIKAYPEHYNTKIIKNKLAEVQLWNIICRYVK